MTHNPLHPLRQAAREFGQAALDLVLPTRCLLCESPADAAHEGLLCAECGPQAGTPWLELPPGCRRCGLPGPENQPECPDCLQSPPAFTQARALAIYDDCVAGAIHALKYQGRHALGGLLGRWMADALPSLLGDVHYDRVVPVPLHWHRRWGRGYNQSELLARPLALHLKIPLELGLRRARATQAQARLGLEARKQNLEGAFYVEPDARPRLQRTTLLLVDDVMTTGYTASLCARALVGAGAARVDVYTVARTL